MHLEVVLVSTEDFMKLLSPLRGDPELVHTLERKFKKWRLLPAPQCWQSHANLYNLTRQIPETLAELLSRCWRRAASQVCCLWCDITPSYLTSRTEAGVICTRCVMMASLTSAHTANIIQSHCLHVNVVAFLVILWILSLPALTCTCMEVKPTNLR